jgi:hypothetical protein
VSEPEEMVAVNQEPSKRGCLGLLTGRWIESMLGVMVAVFGIMTACAAYNVDELGGNEAEAYSVGQRDLTEANFYYAKANQERAGDKSIMAEMLTQAALIPNPADRDIILGKLAENLSLTALENIDPETFILDQQQYDDTVYFVAVQYTSNSDAAFKTAKIWARLGDRYNMLLLWLGLGLGFSAWASLMRSENRMRYVFSGMAALILGWSLLTSIILSLSPRPDEVFSCRDDPAVCEIGVSEATE